jgi:hypothetical protein
MVHLTGGSLGRSCCGHNAGRTSNSLPLGRGLENFSRTCVSTLQHNEVATGLEKFCLRLAAASRFQSVLQKSSR